MSIRHSRRTNDRNELVTAKTLFKRYTRQAETSPHKINKANRYRNQIRELSKLTWQWNVAISNATFKNAKKSEYTVIVADGEADVLISKLCAEDLKAIAINKDSNLMFGYQDIKHVIRIVWGIDIFLCYFIIINSFLSIRKN